MSSPLLEASICGAQGVIANYHLPPNIDLRDINEASEMIYDAASEEVNLMWGVVFDENMEDEIRVTIIATDFEEKPELTAADISSPQPATIASQVSPAAGTIFCIVGCFRWPRYNYSRSDAEKSPHPVLYCNSVHDILKEVVIIAISD